MSNLYSARHPVTLRKIADMWVPSCEYRDPWELGSFDSFAEAIEEATRHASEGDNEGRFCPSCQEYVVTCNDYCFDCGSDT